LFSSVMTNAWIGGTIVAIVAGVVGFFVVLRGAAFAAHTLPSGAFAGAAAARLFGLDQLIGVLLFTGVGVFSISQLGRRGHHDVATALSLVMLLAAGALFLSLGSGYSEVVYALLFGNVLGIRTSQIWLIALIGLFSVVALMVLSRPLLLNSLSPELGEAQGIRNRMIDLAFLVVLGLATAMALPVVGALLVFSLMVGPPSAARFLTSRPGVSMALSVGLSILTVWASIALAYALNWPVGFFVGVLAAVLYGFGRLWAWLSAHGRALPSNVVRRLRLPSFGLSLGSGP
jgi:zinc/manganese transport system permease protein